MQFMQGRDQRCYEVPHSTQPVILHAPLVECEGSQKFSARVIVNPHPVLTGRLAERRKVTGADIAINLPNYSVLTGVAASALLFQPPLEEVTIDYCGRPTQIKVPGGVTFGAVLGVIEKAQAAAKEAMVRSPRFGGYLFRVADRLTVLIRADGAILHDAYYVESARRALEKAKELAVLDELEGKST